jgi:hypothetical protein
MKTTIGLLVAAWCLAAPLTANATWLPHETTVDHACREAESIPNCTEEAATVEISEEGMPRDRALMARAYVQCWYMAHWPGHKMDNKAIAACADKRIDQLEPAPASK